MTTPTPVRVYELDLPLFVPPQRKNVNRTRPPRLAPYNQNWLRSMHWRKQSEHVDQIIEVVAWRAKGQRIPTCDHLTVQLHYAPADATTVDADNLNPSLKAAVDALARPVRQTKAGKAWKGLHLVPDDNDKYVTRLTTVIHRELEYTKRRLWLAVQPGRPACLCSIGCPGHDS